MQILVNTVNTIKSANLKEKTIAIAFILLLTISGATAILPHVNAQINTYSSSPTKGSNGLWNLPTFAGLTVAPTPDGVGQTAQVIMEIELLPPSTGIEAVTGTYGGWLGLMLTVTDPNGTSTSLGPYETDVSGTYQIGYTPDTVGTYTFVMNFPGQVVNGTGFGGYYGNFQASTSRTISLVVQQTPISGYSEAPVPLPTQYWTEPINGQNRYWSTISGPWLPKWLQCNRRFQSVHLCTGQCTHSMENAELRNDRKSRWRRLWFFTVARYRKPRFF